MTPKKTRPNMRQVYFTSSAAAIIAKMPKGDASQAISAAVVAMYHPDDHQRRMAVLAALLYDAEMEMFWNRIQTLDKPNDRLYNRDIS